MKIHSNQLLEALKTVKPAISARPVIPILENVKIEGDKLTATNLNITITAILEDYDEDAITLPYNELFAICNTLDEQLVITPGEIKKSSGGKPYKLGEPSDVSTFPESQVIKGESSSIPENIIMALKKAASVTADPKTGSTTMHVGVTSKEGVITVDGTDAFVAYHESFEVIAPDFAILLPVEIVHALLPDEYTMTLNENSIQFSNDFMTVSGKLAEGKFPDISRIFAGDRPYSLKLNRAQLVDALHEVTVYNILPICHFTFDADGINMIVEDTDTKKEAPANIPLTGVEDTPAINLNAKFLLKVLSLLPEKADEITLSLASAKAPVLISAPNRSIQLLIMPVAL